MVTGMKKKYGQIRDLGVKQAPFYVLLGARMPAILIEASFISNKTECKRLMTNSYRNDICNTIADGIEKYINATIPSTYNLGGKNAPRQAVIERLQPDNAIG